MLEVMKYFGYENAASFRKDWALLTPEDKTQLKTGIENGTLTY